MSYTYLFRSTVTLYDDQLHPRWSQHFVVTVYDSAITWRIEGEPTTSYGFSLTQILEDLLGELNSP